MGIGKQSVDMLCKLVFENYPNKRRFEATTRIDNISMRKVLEACGFVKEAHYREAWPGENGQYYDCTGYSILRKDWESGLKTEVKFNL